MIQFGNIQRKNLQIAISPQQTIQVQYRRDKEKETVYATTKIKNNQPYYVCLVVEETKDDEQAEQDQEDQKMFYDLMIYVNGHLEGNVSITNQIEQPNEILFIGSESANGLFRGEILDLVFCRRPLTYNEIQLISKEKQLPIQEQRQTYQILEENVFQNTHSPEKMQSFYQSPQVKQSIPQSLHKTHITINQDQSQQFNNTTQQNQTQFINMLAQQDLDNLLLRNNKLNAQCRELCFHFKWVFQTLNSLSPPIEGSGQGGIPFSSLCNMIANNELESSDQLPLYVIEFERFIKVIKYAGLSLSKDDILELAQVTRTLRQYVYKYEDLKQQPAREIITGIIYDKFLIGIRDICMTEDEIYQIREQCGVDPNEIPQQQEEDLSQTQQLNQLDNQQPPKLLTTEEILKEKYNRDPNEITPAMYQNKLTKSGIANSNSGEIVVFNSYYELLKLCKAKKLNVQIARNFQLVGFTLNGIPFNVDEQHPLQPNDIRKKFIDKILNLNESKFDTKTIFAKMAGLPQIKSPGDFCQFDLFKKYIKDVLKLEIDPDILADEAKLDALLAELYSFLKSDSQQQLTFNEFDCLFQSFIPSVFYYNKELNETWEIKPECSQNTQFLYHDRCLILRPTKDPDEAFTQVSYALDKNSKMVIPQTINFQSNKRKNIYHLKHFLEPAKDSIEYQQQYFFQEGQFFRGLQMSLKVQNQFQVKSDGSGVKDVRLAELKLFFELPPQTAEDMLREEEEKFNQMLLEKQRQEEERRRQEEEAKNRPKPYTNWNQGKFQIVILHCTNCTTHQGTTWHDEADFTEKFNEFGEMIKAVFPNIEIVGNYEKPTSFECFEVYIRGVGPFQERDDQGRIFLFKKEEKLKYFLYYFNRRVLKAFDWLVLLSVSYAGSIELQKAQEYYFTKFADQIPKKCKLSHDHPAEIPKRKKEIQEQKMKEETISQGTKMICTHWGCGQEYQYSEDMKNNKTACRYHSGSYQLGSIHGLWPESWTCCRNEWGSKGDPNPKTKRPESACGRSYQEGDGSECKYHKGFYQREKPNSDEGAWTCCGQMGIKADPCFVDTHKSAKWPEEEAKKYFIEKNITNPGLIRENPMEPFTKTALRACVYRETIPYIPYVSKLTKQEEERKQNENEDRICLHWGCDPKYKRFKESENILKKQNNKKNCLYHPGVFDFGHTGYKKVSEAMISPGEDTLWKPHWTCCRKEWGEKGCTKTWHWGPVEKTMAPLKYGRWPDISAMKYYKKVNSDLWKKKIADFVSGPEDAKVLWDRVTGSKEYIDSGKFPELCDRFRLHVLAVYEDISFHFKYWDAVRGLASQKLESNGKITRDKFIGWLFTPLEEYPINF